MTLVSLRRMHLIVVMSPICLLLFLATSPLGGQELIVTQNTVLDPDGENDRIVIQASNITSEGRGAWLVGATEGKPQDFEQTAISAKNVSGDILKNINARG